MLELKLKQRLVGAVVLLASAALLVPLLFTGQSQFDRNLFGSNIPDKPDFGFDGDISPEDKQLRPPRRERQAFTLIDEAKTRKVPASTPLSQGELFTKDKGEGSDKEVKSPVASQWVVQVGSFAKRDNAMELRQQLADRGYSAFVKSFQSEQDALFRVYLGPEINKEKAQGVQEKLATELQLQGLVKVYPR